MVCFDVSCLHRLCSCLVYKRNGNLQVISRINFYYNEVVSGSSASHHSLFGRTLLWIEYWNDPPSSAIVIVTLQKQAVRPGPVFSLEH